MRRISIYLFLIILSITKVNAQENATWLDSLSKFLSNEIGRYGAQFYGLDSSKLPTGFLYEKIVFEEADILNYNGLSCKFTCSDHWQKIFQDLQFAQIYSDIIDTISIKAKILPSISNNYIPFGIIDVNYAKFKKDAFERNLISVVDSVFIDNTISGQTAYDIKKVFVASPLISSAFSEEKVFYLDPKLFVSNNNVKIKSIEIDFGDGNGYRLVRKGDYINIRYNISDTVIITTRINYENSQSYYSFSKFYVNNLFKSVGALKQLEPVPAAVTSISLSPHFMPTFTWIMSDGSRVYIQTPYEADGKRRQVIRKPFIFVEGLDFDVDANTRWTNPATTSNQFRNQGLGWDIIRTGIDPEPTQILKAPVALAPAMIEMFQSEGFDFFCVDFKDGTNSIEHNADIVIEVLKKLNNEASFKESNNKITLVGVSMGGIVCRYALSKIEQDPGVGFSHNVRTFVTFDSPHNGANIPISIQYLTQDFQTGDKYNPDFFTNLNKDSPKELLLCHIGESPNALRSQMINSPYYKMPKQPYNIAVSNGYFSKNDLPYKAGDLIYDFHIFNNITSLITIIKAPLLAAITGKKIDINIQMYALGIPGNTVYKRRIDILGGDMFLKDRKSSLSLPLDNIKGGTRGSFIAVDNSMKIDFIHLTLPEVCINILKVKKCIFPKIDLDIPLSSGSGAIYPSHCFIPATSSLSLNTNDINYDIGVLTNYKHWSYISKAQRNFCPFNVVYLSNTKNEQHCEITTDKIDWIKNIVSNDNAKLQDREIDGLYEARNTLTLGENVDAQIPDQGPVIIKASSKVDLFAENIVSIKPGFKMEPGAQLHVQLRSMPAVPQGNPNAILKSGVLKTEFTCPEFDTIEIEKESLINVYDEIFVYPNPTAGMIFISLKEPSDATIEVVDMYGRLIVNKFIPRCEKEKINLSGNDAGIYLIKVRTPQKLFVQKIKLN